MVWPYSGIRCLRMLGHRLGGIEYQPYSKSEGEALSVALSMIVKNESANLANCLKSVAGWVDEMVIVDTGSVDDTIAIAQSFDAQIYQFEWCDDFAAARNYSLQQVKSDWVFVLDADEVLLPEAKSYLTAAMKNPNTLLINHLKEEVGAKQTPFSLVSRLFRNHPQIQFRRPYHELVDDSVLAIRTQEPHWRVETLSEVPAVRHFGYAQEMLDQRGKLKRAQALMEKGIRQYPQDAYLYSKLGGVYWELKDFEKAQTILEQGLALVKGEPAVSYELWFHVGMIQAAQGNIQAAESAYQKAIAQQCPDLQKLGAYLNLGSLYLEHGVLAPAQKLFQHCVQVLPTLAIAHYNLGLAHRSLNQLSDAIASYQAAIAIDPDYAMAHQNLGVVYFKLGRLEESQQAFQIAIALYEKHDPEQAQILRDGVKDLGFEL